MKIMYPITQLLLRYVLAFGFLFPVLDRAGLLGAPGETNVIWGNWENFFAYTNQLMPYLCISMAKFFGIYATVLEILCCIMFIVGYKIRYAALTSFGVTLIFALSMMFFLHFRAPFNFSVFVVSFSSLLLATFDSFPYSLDSNLNKTKTH